MDILRLPTLYQAAIISFTAFLFAKLFIAKRVKGRLPPGPRGLPIVGNMFQIPELQFLKYTEWKNEFGPIFSLNLAGTSVVVLNTNEAAFDLLDRRSHIYSSRPRFIMAGEILSGGLSLGFASYGEVWRRLRKAGHEDLNIRASERYQPVQEVEAVSLVAAILKTPENWEDHLKRTTASTVLAAVYGWPSIESNEDPIITRINAYMHRLIRAALPGYYLVEMFPIMMNLPTWMAPWKKFGMEAYKQDSEMFIEFYDSVAKTMREGNHKPTFCGSLIERQADNQLSSHEAAWLAGSMFGAGSDTTTAILSFFLLAMTLYPGVMRKAQLEIDTIIGSGRRPTFSDAPNLPYMRAIVKEVLRWRAVAPLGLPRETTEDDWYRGYFIPKGTMVIANIWAMNRDPDIYPDFEEFRPDRFLDEKMNEILPPNTHGQGHSTYGFGRRSCLGMNMANNTLFIIMTLLLWAFDVESERGPDGKPIFASRTAIVDNGIVV